ncbi:MAG: hypothetical protein A2W90_20835 [Bacteroidetes bacterium GWF2_42_66]|nr:MAG: hypothetical protein A2W89_03515 [Bacteroidetes bacterium GWE2_42_39]OFY40584.1 MAG: hypothetical protein A2W90_20835 [Bacteroidetes bacterium GWF2_42_66]HBL74536.1 hypothetical protein [Prolixibacteraceae bacterium]HCU63514.1 hypothetical protein [Prolixibacteraceae bacterium]
MTKKYLVGVFDDEHTLVEAFEKVLDKGVKVEEVYTPYPIHEVLHRMKKKTRITHAAFFYGLFAAIGLLGFMYYAAVIDWPLNFGGKPFNTFPSFIVVSIVATILSITLLTLFTFSARAKVFPGKKADIIDIRATDDKFIIVLDKDELGTETNTVTELFKTNGASEVYEKESK